MQIVSHRLGASKKFGGIQTTGGRGRLSVVNAAFTNIPFEHAVLVGIEQAQEMNAIFGDGLEPAEGEQIPAARAACTRPADSWTR